MVGMIEGHFPRDSSEITEKEIRALLVGLSRTRECCHVISVGNGFGQWTKPSHFLSWISPRLEDRKIDKAFLEAAGY
jgi:hypothetical protein